MISDGRENWRVSKVLLHDISDYLGAFEIESSILAPDVMGWKIAGQNNVINGVVFFPNLADHGILKRKNLKFICTVGCMILICFRGAKFHISASFFPEEKSYNEK